MVSGKEAKTPEEKHEWFEAIFIKNENGGKVRIWIEHYDTL